MHGRRRSRGVVDRAATHDELVTAEPHAEVAAAQRVAQPLRHLHEQLVAGRVAEHVVDPLEAVEVDEQQRDTRTAAARTRERAGHLLDEQRAAPEAGEAVVGRVVLEPLLEALAFGDVLERAEEPGDPTVGLAQRAPSAC